MQEFTLYTQLERLQLVGNLVLHKVCLGVASGLHFMRGGCDKALNPPYSIGAFGPYDFCSLQFLAHDCPSAAMYKCKYTNPIRNKANICNIFIIAPSMYEIQVSYVYTIVT